jgi:protein O-GlcNAc transferase
MYGVVHAQQGGLSRGSILIDRALVITPLNWQIHESKSITSERLCRLTECLSDLQRAMALACDSGRLYRRAAIAMEALADCETAETLVERGLVLEPGSGELALDRGNRRYRVGRVDLALSDYNRVITVWPDRPHGYKNAGLVSLDMRRFVSALNLLERASRVDGAADDLSASRLLARMYVCDWSCWEDQLAEVMRDVASGRTVEPFPILGLLDDPASHLRSAQTYARFAGFDVPRSPVEQPRRHVGDKIRIAYYSADYHDHATSYLIAEFIEAHDRLKYEIVGFSFGPDANDSMRSRMSKAFDIFFDVRSWSDRAIAEYSQELGIDVAVDLKGYTRGARPKIFSIGCAPIQISYLGYPGTTAIPKIDYVIADKFVVPREYEKFFTEKVIYLPGCYQSNDSTRVRPVLASQKVDAGLAADLFVYCCFNAMYKIHPVTFASWMRILRSVPNSVLWLIDENSVAAENLRNHAVRSGVDPARLIFAPRVSNSEHLTRLAQADLFLDTFPYTAHTTASDALWAGVPVLTRAGRSFPSRVAGSLLSTLGLDELVTYSESEYENLAVELALCSGRLAEVRRRLAEASRSSKLFDGKWFCKKMEQVFETIIHRHKRGYPPTMLDLTDQ